MKLLFFTFYVFLTCNLHSQQSNNEEISYEDILKNKAREMTKELGRNFSIIANKNVKKEVKERILFETTSLFLNDQCKIEVSSKYRPETNIFPIREYLLRLMHLSASNGVYIEFKNVFVDKDIEQTNDGSYKVALRIIQIFKKFDSNNKLIYDDITEKSIELFITASFSEIQNKKFDVNSIKFGNMIVLETYNKINKNTIKNENVTRP